MRTRRTFQKWAALGTAALTSACATGYRIPPPLATGDRAFVPGFEARIRTSGDDPRLLADAQLREDQLARLYASADGSFDVLALSGGGSGGAYGAGLLVGLTRAGHRPQFEIVTGVSTGALIAPFAFLGPDWDDELEAAYTGPGAANLLHDRGIGILFDPSLYDGEPLVDLVDSFVTDELVAAVAREYAKGRALMVATTDLDTQDSVLWDMGRIASRGGEEGRALFRDVLVASASVPGVFPPVMIDVEQDGQTYAEMHVDGSVAMPFFVAPQVLSLWSDPRGGLRGGNIYVVVNGRIESVAGTTPVNSVSILARSFDTNQLFQARSSMLLVANFAQRNGMTLQFARIGTDVDYRGSLDFDADYLKALFDDGVAVGQGPDPWTTQEQHLDSLRRRAAGPLPRGAEREHE